MTEETQPHHIDLHVGGMIRTRRKILGVSQEKLADALDLTFQQVQKYERGSNRVSASKLWEISLALQVSPAYFFEGLEGGAEDKAPGRERDVHAFLMTSEGLQLAQEFPKISRGPTRRSVLDLVHTLAN